MTQNTSSFRILAADNTATDARLHRVELRLDEAGLGYSTATANLRLLLVVRGQTRILTDHQSTGVPLGEGQVAMMPPNTAWSGNWQGSVDCMLLEIVPSLLFEHTNGPIQPPASDTIRIVNDARLRHLLSILRQTLKAPPVAGDLLAQHLSRAMACHYLRRYCGSRAKHLTGGAGLSRRQLQLVAESLNARIRDRITLVDLAEVVGMNGAAFCKRFKRTVGVPPYQYILRTRVGQAKKQLHENGLNLCEIALSLGFYDQSQFTNTFRRIVGVSPRTYRQQIQN